MRLGSAQECVGTLTCELQLECCTPLSGSHLTVLVVVLSQVLAEPLTLRHSARPDKKWCGDPANIGASGSSASLKIDEASDKSALKEESATRQPAPAADNESTPRRLDALVDIHPFFSPHGTDDDLETLLDALAVRGTGEWEGGNARDAPSDLLWGCLLTLQVSECPHELVSFPLVVHQCVEAPVRLVGRTLDHLGVDFFVAELHVMRHIQWLHRILLLSEGLCMDIFARDLLLGLRSPTRVTWALSDRLTSVLTLAMIESKIYSDACAPRFHYATTDAVLQGACVVVVFPRPLASSTHSHPPRRVVTQRSGA